MSVDWYKHYAEGMSMEEVADWYGDWANQDNNDTKYMPCQGLYRGPENLMEHLTPYLRDLDPRARVLDVGAGRGRLGELLRPVLGPEADLECLEPCKRMIDDARKLPGVYTKFYDDIYVGELNSVTQFASDTFDCVCALGAFLPCHVPPEGLLEMIRLTKIGGITATMTRHMYIHDEVPYAQRFRAALKVIKESSGVQELVHKDISGPEFFVDATDGTQYMGTVLIYRKTGPL